ncbi:sensor histidine kinase KdpD [Sphingomonas sp. SORGH_AS_0879]|uniref:sensor histidine kinase n=1 Tax=Sphingomonas sp. SORGH_AS_0879 TaxID=3041790 RepID=UPI00277F88B3|nr:HAMP domain-containing sensor histidine kinase [Sphingomonas sp. SORGH_AS_0879]MDQ1230991.1 signal transduction histidine kinase [Sphingomonas sp. SORGH_AS_0879]
MNEKKIAHRSPLTDNFDLSLVANFAHQLINPLNGVAGTLDRLYEGKIKEEFRQKQRLNAIRAQVENCIILTRNLAYLAIGFGELGESDKKTVILPQNLIEACMFHQEEAESRGIELFVNERDIQNSVRAHPDLIRQVFMNLVDNSVKYSSDNSKVEILHHIQARTNDAIISIRSKPSHRINEQDFINMFQVGVRGENAKRVIASGTGLGLYICKQIVETAHNGKISAARYDHDQVEFTIRLPNGLRGTSDRKLRQR